MNSRAFPIGFRNKIIHELIARMIQVIIKLVQPIVKNLSLIRKEIWLLEGLDPRTQKPWRILYAGQEKEKHYIGNVYFGGDYTCRSLGDRWLWQLFFHSKTLPDTCCFSVVQTRWPITRHIRLKNLYCIPFWVYGSVDLSDDVDENIHRSKSARYNIARMKKSRFKIEISRDMALFDDFYTNMFQAYIGKRHDRCSVIDPYERMKARFQEDGEILFVKKGSQRIAGMIISYDHGEAAAYRLGVRDGDFQWVKEGAITALYYHTIKHCRDKGFKKLHLGGSRPFLSDGVLNYKIKNWNMKIDGYPEHFYFLLKPLRPSVATEKFLYANAFISLKGRQLVANTFIPDAGNHAYLEKLRNDCKEKGLRCVDVHNLETPRFHKQHGKG